jgi:hypothetical protein
VVVDSWSLAKFCGLCSNLAEGCIAGHWTDSGATSFFGVDADAETARSLAQFCSSRAMGRQEWSGCVANWRGSLCWPLDRQCGNLLHNCNGEDGMLGLEHGCGIMGDPTLGRFCISRVTREHWVVMLNGTTSHPFFRRVDGQGSVLVVMMMNGTTSHTFSAGRTASPFCPHALLHGALVQLRCCGVQLWCCGPLS